MISTSMDLSRAAKPRGSRVHSGRGPSDSPTTTVEGTYPLERASEAERVSQGGYVCGELVLGPSGAVRPERITVVGRV